MEIVRMGIRKRLTGLVGAVLLAGAGLVVAATPANAADSYRQIYNREWNQCIDVDRGSTEVGVQLQIATCNGTGAQAWQPVKVTGQIYYFINRNSSYCIDVRGGSTAAGAAVQQYTCNGSVAQQWIRTTFLADGLVWETFQNVNSGLLLDTVSGAGSKLMQWPAGGNKAQDWQLQ